MAIKRAIIHLGMPKAGSSSIQYTLYENASILEKNGFKYLTEWGIGHHDKFHSLFFNYRDCPPEERHPGAFLSLGFKKLENKNAINTLLKVINNSKCEVLILSGEFFRTLYLDSTVERIKNFINEYFHSKNIETTIIYYARNPLAWMDSWTSQIIFSSGYLNRDGDFFEAAIKQYHGIFNLKKHFGDRLRAIKFEDACQDKDGLVANFLRTVEFPEDKIKNIDMSGSRRNESRAMEAIEFAHFVEAMEARDSFGDFKRYIPSRFYRDITPLKNIKGVKFALPSQSKAELWDRLQETVKFLKERANVDYTDYVIPPSTEQGTYNEQTIQGFIDAFPKLNLIIQKYFLKFFEKKYMETAQEKFKQLYFSGSIPYAIYKRNNSFFGRLSAKIRITARLISKVLKTKMPKLG